MALQANKIILKEATKMSLHDRFTVYRQQSRTTAASNVRQNAKRQIAASAKNQRLAQQMANRPSVIAALKIKKVFFNVWSAQKSLKQRLGNGFRGNPSATTTGVKGRLSLGIRQNIQNRLGRRGVTRGGSLRSGNSPMVKARLGTVQQQQQRGPSRGRAFFQSSGFRRGPNRTARANHRRGRGFNRGFGKSQRGGRGQFRSSLSGRGIAARGRGGATARKGLPSKQELDNQLDEYMAQTKAHLDADLDAYMAEAE